MRDITLEETFRFPFTTRAFATGIPTTLAGTPVLSVLEENNATPITAGVSISVDRASVGGLNEGTVIATAANGYEAGKSYGVYISTGTVSGVSVIGEVVYEFTIELSAAFTRLGAPAGASVSVDIADLPTVSEFNARTLVAASYFDPAADAVANVTLVATTTTNTDMRGTDSALLAASINLTAGAVDNVTTVATTTTNTDMRGTDSALLAANINLTGGAVDNVTLVATTTTNTDMRGTDGVDTATMRGTDSAALASVATEARLAELDAANLPATTDATLTDTGTTLPAQIAALNDISVADILTTQMTQSYAADGVAPTLAQALFFIQQLRSDFSIAGTTYTVRQLDGSTTAYTLTLDSATTPTAATRAT